LFSQADTRATQRTSRPILQTANTLASRPRPSLTTPFRSAAKVARPESTFPRSEPTYHNLSMSSKPTREVEYLDNPHVS
jgi:hypothetical protein